MKHVDSWDKVWWFLLVSAGIVSVVFSFISLSNFDSEHLKVFNTCATGLTPPTSRVDLTTNVGYVAAQTYTGTAAQVIYEAAVNPLVSANDFHQARSTVLMLSVLKYGCVIPYIVFSMIAVIMTVVSLLFWVKESFSEFALRVMFAILVSASAATVVVSAVAISITGSTGTTVSTSFFTLNQLHMSSCWLPAYKSIQDELNVSTYLGIVVSSSIQLAISVLLAFHVFYPGYWIVEEGLYDDEQEDNSLKQDPRMEFSVARARPNFQQQSHRIALAASSLPMRINSNSGRRYSQMQHSRAVGQQQQCQCRGRECMCKTDYENYDEYE